MITSLRHSATFLALASLSLLGGCINLDPVTDPTQFYILSTGKGESRQEGRAHLLVRNLELADYLKTSQLAQRESPNKVAYLANHRWAGPFDEMIAEIIAEEITAGSSGMSASTMATGGEGFYLDVRIQQFDFTPGSSTNLVMEYVVTNAKTREPVSRDWVRIHRKIPTDASHEEIVKLLEQTLREGVSNISF